MKNFLLLAFTSVLSLALPACGDKEDDAKPTSVTLELNMVGFQNTPNAFTSAVGGLAQTEAEATTGTAGTDELLFVSATSAETQHGARPVEATLDGKKRGDKLWLYMSCSQALRRGQVITYKLSTPEGRYFYTYDFTAATPRANGRTVVEVTIP